MKTTNKIVVSLFLVLLCTAWFVYADRDQAAYKGPKGAAQADSTLKLMYNTMPVIYRCAWPCPEGTNTAGAQTNVYRLVSMTSETWPTISTGGQYLSFIIFTNGPTRVTTESLTAEALTFMGGITTSTTVRPFVTSVTTTSTVRAAIETMTTSAAAIVTAYTTVNITNQTLEYTFANCTNWTLLPTYKTCTNYTFIAHTEPVSNVWFNPIPGNTSSWIMLK